MKKVFCFGDSNTFGYIPETGHRYSRLQRWTGVLQDLCKDEFEIVEGGCNNRTGFSLNPAGFEQTGYKILPTLLRDDFDCVILAIGINDLQIWFNTTIDKVETGLKNLVEIVRKNSPGAKIIIAAPSVLTEDVLKGNFSFQFNEKSIEASHKLGSLYKQTAEKCNCAFIDLNDIAEVSSVDGLHYSVHSHEKIAHAMYGVLSRIF